MRPFLLRIIDYRQSIRCAFATKEIGNLDAFLVANTYIADSLASVCFLGFCRNRVARWAIGIETRLVKSVARIIAENAQLLPLCVIDWKVVRSRSPGARPADKAA